jgi:hypothetical protein
MSGVAVQRALSLAVIVSAALLLAPNARAADPVKKACLGDCKQQGTACKDTATSERTLAEELCAADPATEKECRATAKGAFKAAKKACKAARKDCKRCCKEGGGACIRPDDLPPPFATGRGEQDVELDDEGCLSADDDLVFSTDLGIEVELDEDTCFVGWDGNLVTGSRSVVVDDAGGLLAQGSPGFLQGVIRILVEGAGGDFVAFDEPAEVRVELDDGSLPGRFEAVTWLEGDTYASGPSQSGERTEVVITQIPVLADAPEEFEYWGGGPVGIRYVPPAAPVSALGARAPRGPLNSVSIDLLQSGLSAGFESTYPNLCTWQVIAPQTAEVLATDFVAGGLPHGQTAQSGDYLGSVQLGGTPTFVVESPYLNRLVPTGFVCDDLSTSQEFRYQATPDGRGEGGSPEEADLAGPYDGRLILLIAGRATNQLQPIAQLLQTTFPAPAHPVIRTFRQTGPNFSMIADVYGHPESVRTIASAFPSEYRYEFDDRFAVVNITPLFFDFASGEQGWAGGVTSNPGDFGTVVHLDRSNGVMKLDGVDGGDNQEPNAWIERSVELPASATKLELDVSAHDRDGANAFYRVRLVDGGGSHTLIDWTLKSGIEGRLTFSTVSASIAPYAGQTVTLFLEQDGNAPGAHEQIYYDNVFIH